VEALAGVKGRDDSWSIQHVSVGRSYLHGMAPVSDRVHERRRAVELARHYRESEGLSIAQIAQRLGRSPATVKAYLYDPTGEKAKAVKARYQGICRGCGAPTQPRNGKGDADAYCKTCHPGAIAPRSTRERVREAMRAWRDRYGAACGVRKSGRAVSAAPRWSAVPLRTLRHP
jgi:AraC-like DNA-binding protein